VADILAGEATFGIEEALSAEDWIEWCKQAHERPLLLRAVDLQTLELERMYDINPKMRRRS
jgi:hypothetical protein